MGLSKFSLTDFLVQLLFFAMLKAQFQNEKTRLRKSGVEYLYGTVNTEKKIDPAIHYFVWDSTMILGGFHQTLKFFCSVVVFLVCCCWFNSPLLFLVKTWGKLSQCPAMQFLKITNYNFPIFKAHVAYLGKDIQICN